MMQLQEHDMLTQKMDERFKNLNLVKWDKPKENSPLGYYATYKIGAEWVDDKEAIVVTTKRRMENIDFLGMFMTCFNSGIALDSFSQIYQINVDAPPIDAPVLASVQSLLIVAHFLNVVNRIKTLKRGYVHHSENLKKIKGRVSILKNERKNITTKRFNQIYCEYDEYSVDIPENRIIKRALLVSQRIMHRMGSQNVSYRRMKQLMAKSIALFENVSKDVEIREVSNIKGHKLFMEYNEATRLATIILRYYDKSINIKSDDLKKVMPFVIDMSLLYEHYVYGLLVDAYASKIVYQRKGETGYPDFLYCSKDYKAILDAKYIPKYENKALDKDVVWQLSGYSRDLPILKRLGYVELSEVSPVPNVPCIIIYPTEGKEINNPFKHKRLKTLCEKHRIKKLSQFYEVNIPLPTMD